MLAHTFVLTLCLSGHACKPLEAFNAAGECAAARTQWLVAKNLSVADLNRDGTTLFCDRELPEDVAFKRDVKRLQNRPLFRSLGEAVVTTLGFAAMLPLARAANSR
jgi:hypothetical protein